MFLLNGVVKCVLEWECCARTVALLQLLDSIEHDSCVSALSITPKSCIPQPYLTGPTFQVWNKPMQANPAFQVPAFAWHHLFLLQRLQQAYSGCCPSNLSHGRSCRGTQDTQHNGRQLDRMDVLLKANIAKVFTNTIM